MSGWPPYVPTALPPRLPKDDGWMFIYIIGDAEGWQCAACRKMATSGHLRSKKHKVARNSLSLYRSFLEEAEETINRVNGRLVDPDLAAGSVPVAPWWVPPAGAQAKQAIALNGTVWVSWPRLNNLGAARADPAPQSPAACAEQPPDWAQASNQSAQVPPPAAAQTEQAVAPNGTIPACVPLASLGTACADPAPQRPAACAGRRRATSQRRCPLRPRRRPSKQLRPAGQFRPVCRWPPLGLNAPTMRHSSQKSLRNSTWTSSTCAQRSGTCGSDLRKLKSMTYRSFASL